MEISPASIAARIGSQLLKPLASVGSASANPYGTVKQSYAVMSTIQANESSSIKLDAVPNKVAGRSITATGARLLAVAQAIKGATQVDPSTGLHEIKEGAVADLTKALTAYFSDLESDAPIIGTETGALSPGDLKNAVRSAIDAITSGGNGAFSLSLTATKTFTVADSLSTTYAAGAGKPTISLAGTSTTIRTMTFGLSLGTDGTLSATYSSDADFADKGLAVMQGNRGASATASPTDWFVGTFGPDAIASNIPVREPITGLQESEIRTSTYAQANQTEVIGASNHGQASTDALTNLDGAGVSLSDMRITPAGYAAQTALHTLEAIVESGRSGKADRATLLFRARVPAALSVFDPRDGTTVLYRRPDGTPGRFGLAVTDKTA